MLDVVTPYGRTGGSSRVRVFDWLDHLGMPATVHDYLGTPSSGLRDLAKNPASTVAAEIRTRRVARKFTGNHLLVSRNASPLSRGRTESNMLRRAAHGVYDFDDALWHSASTGQRTLGSKSRIWHAAVGAADHVIAGNSYLAEAAVKFNPNVTIVPSCIEPSTYRPKTRFDLSAQPHAIWLGSPSTEKYLIDIEEALLREHQRSGLRLTVISRGDNRLGRLDPMIDRVDWTLDGFAAGLEQADFGIMPLPDDPWTRGKCAYKLLQYAATALPVIGSPTGANGEVLSLLGGLAPVSVDEWTDALSELVTSPTAERARLGALALAGVSEHFSYSRWATTWRSVVLPG